jgi:hypothetical protein
LWFILQQHHYVDYMAFDGGMFSELEKGLETSRHGLIVVISWHLPGGTEENHEKLQSGELESQPRFKPSVF